TNGEMSDVADLGLEGADVDGAPHDAREAVASLVEIGRAGVVASIDGRAAGEQGHRQGGPAVVLERAGVGVNGIRGGANEVGAGVAAAAIAIADQVVTLAVHGALHVGSGGQRGVSCDDCVSQTASTEDPAANATGGVAGESATGQSQRRE